jgi:hypothetical protein
MHQAHPHEPVYGAFALDGVDYIVTGSAAPDTVAVFASAADLMVCSVRDPRGAAEAAWGSAWCDATGRWQAALLSAVGRTVGAWFAAFEQGLAEGPGSST